MTHRTAAACAAVALTLSVACSRAGAPAPAPVDREFEFGPRRVRVAVPAGWDAFDQGQQKRFRKAEAEVVLRDLGPADPPGDLELIADWGLTVLGHDERRDVKSRRVLTVDGRETMEIETWNRLAHTGPQRFLFMPIGGRVLALYTPRLADEETVSAFEAIRGSLHFTATGADSGRR